MRQAVFQLIFVRGQGPRLKADVGNGVFYATPTPEMLEAHKVGDLVGEYRFREGKKIAVAKDTRFFLREAELVERVPPRPEQLLNLLLTRGRVRDHALRQKPERKYTGSRLYEARA